MKYVVLLLLAANGAYFAWEWTSPSPPPPPAIQPDRGNIVLVSELETPPPPAAPVERPPEPDVVAGSLAAPSGGCAGLGPLSDLEQAQALVERLAGRNIAGIVQPLDELLEAQDYRVLIDPAPSLEAAFRKLRELQSQDIDSYVIAQGEYALAISLGVYSTEAAAEEAQADIQDKGYAPSIVAMPRTVRQYWVVAGVGTTFDDAQVAALGDDLAVRPFVCASELGQPDSLTAREQ